MTRLLLLGEMGCEASEDTAPRSTGAAAAVQARPGAARQLTRARSAAREC